MNISSVATITVDATASSSGDLISTATVTSDNDQNPNNDVVNQTVTANVNLEDQFQFTLTPKFVPTIVSSSQGGTVEYTVEVVNLTPNRETVEIYKTLNGAGERRLSRRTLYTGRSTIIRGREYIRNSFPDGNHTIEIRLVTSNGEMTRSFNFTKDIIDISTIGFDVVPLFNPSVLGFTGGTLEYSVDLLNTSASRVITEVFKSINGGPERRLTRATLSAGRGRLVRGRERVLSSFPNGDHTLTITLRMDGQEVSQNINFRKGSVGGSGQIDFVMNPVDLPIILGSRGGNVSYNILVVNNTSDSQLIEVFRTITGPNKNDERRVTRRTLRPGTSSVIKRRDRLSSRDADGSYTIDVRLVTPAGEQTQSFNFDKISN